jgi:hypothetical protein
LDSPREYNFANDEITISVDVDYDKVKEYLLDNKESFSKYIEEKNTSYD